MPQTVRALILRATKYGETSLICQAYSEESGWQSYMINGARSARAKHSAGVIYPMSLVEMVVYAKPGNAIQRVSEVRAGRVYRSLPFDVRKTTVGLFLSEILSKALRDEPANPELFAFISGALGELDEAPAPTPFFHLIFLLRLTRLLGFYPHGAYAEAKPFFDLREGIFVSVRPPHGDFADEPHSRHLHQLLQDETPAMTRGERKKLLEHLIRYFRLHVAHFGEMRSPQVLEALFAD